MATLTAPQLVNLRTKAHRSSLYLSVFQPATLLSAQVNNVAIARGARTIAYDTGTGTAGQFAAIEGYQLLEVDISTGTEYVRVKSIAGNEVTGTVTVDENAINWGDNNPIRIKHFYPMVAVPPAIRSGIFYKFYDEVYVAQNSTPNPVTIIGPHLVGVLSAGSVAFSLNSSSSYAIAQGATISSRVWSCIHNGGATTDIAFSSTIAANPTLTITAAGQYWLKCTVTDSNSKTQATWRAIFVYSTLEDAYTDFTVSSLSGDWNLGGWQASVEVNGVSTLSSFPDGALAVIHYKNYFDATEGYVDLWGTEAQNIVLSGYIRRDQDNDNFDDGTGKVNFDITTPDGVMDNMSELGSISLNAAATVNKWWKYASWLTVGRGIHHLLKWHSSVLETCDVLGLTDNTLGVKNTDFTEPSVLQMVNGLGYQRGHFAKLVSSRLGRLYFATDSQMLNTAARAALDTVFTIATSDVSGTVDVVRQPEAVIGVADLDGFSFNGTTSTPFISIMPGYRESAVSYGLPGFRGSSPASAKSQVLNDQTDGNEKVGRVFAQANNNPLEIRFATPANYLGAFDIVPSIGWYNWGIADAVLKRNTELNGRLLLCRNVTHEIDTQSGTIQTSVVFEPEATGPDGIQGNYPVGYPTPSLRPPDWESPVDTYDFVLAYYDDNETAGRARIGSVGPLAVGAAQSFKGATVAYVAVCATSSSSGVICYQLASDTQGKAIAFTRSGTVLTFGSEATFNAAATTWIACTALSSTSVIVAYRDSDTFGKAIILSISGTTITVPGSEAAFDSTGAIQGIGLAYLSPSKAIVGYSNGGTAGACVLSVSGSTITPGTPQGSATSGDYCSICALDAQTAVMTLAAGVSLMHVIALTGITTSFTYGASVQVAASTFDDKPGQPFIAKLDGSRFIITFQEAGGASNFDTRVIAGSNASGVLSLGTSLELLSGGANYTDWPTVVTVKSDGSQAVAGSILSETLTIDGAVRSVTTSGTTLTDSADEVTWASTAGDKLYLASAALKAVGI